MFAKMINDLYVFYYNDYKQHFSYSFSIFSSLPTSKSCVFSYVSASYTMTWQKRLGHTDVHKLQLLSLSSSNCNKDVESCDICCKSKQHRLPLHTSVYTTNAPFKLLHVDVWRPYKHTIFDGFKYFFSIVDEYRRHTQVDLITHKSYAFFYSQSIHLFHSKSIQSWHQNDQNR